ncbi:hypothetical protein ACJX0J_013732, partial [Zea mays]
LGDMIDIHVGRKNSVFYAYGASSCYVVEWLYVMFMSPDRPRLEFHLYVIVYFLAV